MPEGLGQGASADRIQLSMIAHSNRTRAVSALPRVSASPGPAGQAAALLAMRLRAPPQPLPHPHELIALTDPCLDFAVEFIGVGRDQRVDEPPGDDFLDAREAWRVESVR